MDDHLIIYLFIIVGILSVFCLLYSEITIKKSIEKALEHLRNIENK